MARRLTDDERRARTAEAAYRRALALSTVAGPAAHTETEVARMRAHAEEMREHADEQARIDDARRAIDDATIDTPTITPPPPTPKPTRGPLPSTRTLQRTGRRVAAASGATGLARGLADSAWAYVGVVLALSIVYLLLRHPDRVNAAVAGGGLLLQGFIWPVSHPTTVAIAAVGGQSAAPTVTQRPRQLPTPSSRPRPRPRSVRR